MHWSEKCHHYEVWFSANWLHYSAKLFFEPSFCLLWQEQQGSAKVESIGTFVLESINEQCPSCQLTNDRLTDAFLQCSSSSPQTVTYRAAMHGTGDITSPALVAEIANLVASGESIRVLGASMTVVTDCGVRILSFEEALCSAGDSQLPLIPIIVGGALGGVILIMVCCIILVVVVMVKKRRKRKLVPTRRQQR